MNAPINQQRILNLVDGVFSIVMTLMIFDFKLPHISNPDLIDTILAKKLIKLWPKFLSYVYSAIVLGIFWVYHHQQFRFINRVDRNLIWINILFIITVAFIPFSAALVAEYPAHTLAITVYGFNVFSIGLVLLIHWRYANSFALVVKDELIRASLNYSKNLMIATSLFFVALLMGPFFPQLSMVIFVIVPLYHLRPVNYKRK
jgi:uncharacterized membrane protein